MIILADLVGVERILSIQYRADLRGEQGSYEKLSSEDLAHQSRALFRKSLTRVELSLDNTALESRALLRNPLTREVPLECWQLLGNRSVGSNRVLAAIEYWQQ